MLQSKPGGKMRLLISTVICATVFSVGVPARADTITQECSEVDFSKIFSANEELNWLGSNARVGETVTITWSAQNSTIAGKPTVRPFTAKQLELLQFAFDQWDSALDSVTFTRSEGSIGRVDLGWTGTNDSSTFTYWWTYEYNKVDKRLVNSTFNFGGDPKISDALFLERALSAVGRILGLGAYEGSNYDTVLKFAKDATHTTITDTDRKWARQFYGEEICRAADRDQIRYREMSANVASLQNSLDELRLKLDTLSQQLSQYKLRSLALEAKIAKICRAKPKPKGC